MSFNAHADQAIEQWARRHRPPVADHKWHKSKPDANWHYQAISWEAEMDRIQTNFEALIGFQIALSPKEKRNSVSLIMDDIAYVLVRKAETKTGRTLLKVVGA